MCECMNENPPAHCPTAEERLQALRDGYVSADWRWYPDGRLAPRADDDPTPPCGNCVGPCQCRAVPLGLDEDEFQDLVDAFSASATPTVDVDADPSVELDPGLRTVLDSVADALGDLGRTVVDTISGRTPTQRQQEAAAAVAAARRRETLRTIIVVGVGALAIVAVLKHRRG